jgi:hypothetical protein
VDINKLPLTLSSRPKLRDIPALARDHDIFVTLLMEEENSDDIGTEVKRTGKSWWHCPFSVLARHQKKYDFNLVTFTVEKLCQALIDKQRIFIHCDTGVDGTGTITLATLIALGFKKRQAVGFLISQQPKAENRLHWDYVDKIVTSVLAGRQRSRIDRSYYPILARAYTASKGGDQLLTSYELASLLRSSAHIVKSWLHQCAIPAVKDDDMWSIKQADLDQFIKSKTYLDYQKEKSFLSWGEVKSIKDDAELQSTHSPSEGKNCYLSKARSCPKCDTPAAQLTWVYWSSSKWTWSHLCGRAGWLVVCEPCQLQTDFFLDRMS